MPAANRSSRTSTSPLVARRAALHRADLVAPRPRPEPSRRAPSGTRGRARRVSSLGAGGSGMRRQYDELALPPRLLLGAGPSNPDPRVLQVLALPPVGPLDPA